MARPKQDGLLYFPFDTDFFYADNRIKRLHAKFGNDGLIFYIYLLTEIYRNGYYISWDEESAEDVAADLGLKEGFIEQVLAYLRTRSLLTMSTLNTEGATITSPGIQKRYQEAIKSRKRDVYVDSEIWLLDEKETAAYIKFAGNESKSCGNESKSCGNDINESKVNKSKVKQRERIQRIEDFISEYPKDCNRHLTETAYIDLILTGKITEDELVQCANNYADSCAILKTPERYIKNAENFLKDMVFDKYLPGKYKKPRTEKRKHKNAFHNFEQRDTDYDAAVMNQVRKWIAEERDTEK